MFARLVAAHAALLLRNDKGVTAIEYGLIAGLIAVFIVVAVGATGNKVGGTFDAITAALPN